MLLGDCVRVLDKTLRPPAMKRFVCIEPAYFWFLRINTKSIWRPNFGIAADESNGALDHDSYVELIRVHCLSSIVHQIAAGEAQEIGRFPIDVAAGIGAAALSARTLPRYQVRIIEARLLA